MLFKNIDSIKHNHESKLHLGMQVFFHQKRLIKGEKNIFWRNKLQNQNGGTNNSTSKLVAINTEDVQCNLSKSSEKNPRKELSYSRSQMIKTIVKKGQNGILPSSSGGATQLRVP